MDNQGKQSFQNQNPPQQAAGGPPDNTNLQAFSDEKASSASQNVGQPPTSASSFASPEVNSYEPTPTGFTQTPPTQNPSFAQPQAAQATENQPQQGPITTAVQKPGGSKFKVFIIIAVLAIIAIYAAVAFLYFQNQNLKGQDQESQTENTSIPQTSPQVTQAPTLSPDNLKVLNGSIVLYAAGDQSQYDTLVDKNDYSSTGIAGFSRVTLSPDLRLICFESWPPSPEPALYLSKSDGSDVAEVSPNRQNCLWGQNSNTIFYSDYVSENAQKNIYKYDLSSAEETNLTLEFQPSEVNLQFSIVGLSANQQKLLCTYAGDANSSGTCEIDLVTSEVVLLPESE